MDSKPLEFGGFKTNHYDRGVKRMLLFLQRWHDKRRMKLLKKIKKLEKKFEAHGLEILRLESEK